MAEERTRGQRWQEYRPSKATWFWSCVGIAILTMIIGFGWGGWVTGGTAEKMAEDAATNARATLVASVCVERFQAASDVQAQLAALEKESTWQRDDFIKKGGWAKLDGVSEPVPDAANLCAERLMEAASKPAEKTQG
jgi:hypothetical protein